MTTLERPQDDVVSSSPTVAAPEHLSRMWMLVALVAILALLLGGAVGWFLNGDDDPRAVYAGDGDLTERQLDMIEFMDDYVDAWQRSDADALVAMYAPSGRFVSLGTTYLVSDGSLAALIRANDWSSLTPYEPNVVRGNEMLGFHSFPGGVFMNSMTFTGDGELLLLNHTVTD